MPIAETELNKAANAHIVMPANKTVYAALTAWRDAPDNYEWWWLIIDHGSRRYTAVRFEGLRAVLAHPDLDVHMNTALADLPPHRNNPADWEHPFPGVFTPTVVERAALGTARALQTMQDSPGRVLIVLDEGEFLGILSASERTFAFADKPLLDMLDDFEAHGDDDTRILPVHPDDPPPSPDPPDPSDA